MKTVRVVASLLFYLSRVGSFLFFAAVLYAASVVLLHSVTGSASLPITVDPHHRFQIFYPFTRQPFLLGDYTATYLVTNFILVSFYGFFLLLLSGVFQAFRQSKLFTPKGVTRLSRFYITNLLVPVLFLSLLLFSGESASDIVRIIFLHIVVGVFAYFMAAIFQQGVLLQEEQDLTF